jgi:hypothetical protein
MTVSSEKLKTLGGTSTTAPFRPPRISHELIQEYTWAPEVEASD